MDVTDLPIESSVPAVLAAMDAPGVGVLTSPPGSGKTTVVPLRLMNAPWRDGRKIVVLEPRRLATRAAARRMADLRGTPLGEEIGYVTRNDRATGPGVIVEVVTEGVLTRRLQRDPELADTAAVLFDEVHERNLQTDLGMALALDVRASIRPDLRILAMSATIDAARIARLLGDDVPIVEGTARTHPIDIRWSPEKRRGSGRSSGRRNDDHVAAIVGRALDAELGDVLVFLPGIGEINRVADRLAEAAIPAVVRKLHGSLPLDQQDEALMPDPMRRKVVLSTDIAETSLTVEGVRIVVDSGLARSPRYDPRTGMTRLVTVSISKASADQRAGRAGRTEPGVAYRAWSKIEHAGRPAHIQPEITEVDLAGLMLELAQWGVTDPESMAFIDPPRQKSVDDARQLLQSLGALDMQGLLTSTGSAMAALPLHPRLGRMVTAAPETDRYLAVVLAAIVDERDMIRGRPDDVPADIAQRVRLILDPAAHHPRADRRSIARVRRSAEDLARRSRVTAGPVDTDACGRLLALAFPDRLAIRRGSAGRFQLRTGSTAFVASSDSLSEESFLVPADLDGKRKDARIRLAAAIDADEVAAAFDEDVEERIELVWDRERLVERRERRLGGLVLDSTDRRPGASEATTTAILARVVERGIDRVLPWSKKGMALRARVTFLHRELGGPWPDWSEAGLAARVEQWLGPYVGSITGLDDLANVDLTTILRSQLPYPDAARLDELVPSHYELPSGRRIPLDYTADAPGIAVRVQELYGVTSTPSVAGRPLRLTLLSPADRPIQVTTDLPGFWAGSWSEVRKDMAGRYPKHHWPEDPANASPKRP